MPFFMCSVWLTATGLEPISLRTLSEAHIPIMLIQSLEDDMGF